MTNRTEAPSRPAIADRLTFAVGLALAIGGVATGTWMLAERLADPVAISVRAVRLACAIACPAPF